MKVEFFAPKNGEICIEDEFFAASILIGKFIAAEGFTIDVDGVTVIEFDNGISVYGPCTLKAYHEEKGGFRWVACKDS